MMAASPGVRCGVAMPNSATGTNSAHSPQNEAELPDAVLQNAACEVVGAQRSPARTRLGTRRARAERMACQYPTRLEKNMKKVQLTAESSPHAMPTGSRAPTDWRTCRWP